MVRQLVSEKENSEFKPVKLRLKIDLVSYPARAEGLVNSMKDMLLKIKVYHHCLLYEFQRGSNAAETFSKDFIVYTNAVKIRTYH